jgi:5-methylcytosine-specific restriction endonuclease McrA
MEVDSRRLYLGQGCSSLFTFCTEVFHLGEHAAYNRIEAARASRRFPIVLDLLADGSITLTNVRLVAPHLTQENHRAILKAARHKSKRDIEHLVAALRPQPPVASTVRKLPVPSVPVSSLPNASPEIASPAQMPRHSSSRPVAIVPLAPEIYRIQFTMSREMHDRLRQAQDSLRDIVPNGDPAVILDRALKVLLKELEKNKHAATYRPRRTEACTPRSRRVPARIRREVWKRDGGQCAFVGPNGRCTERGLLEYHHVQPYAAGGLTTTDNLQLRCRSHNRHEADLFFGPFIARESRATWTTRSGTSWASVRGPFGAEAVTPPASGAVRIVASDHGR